MIDSKILASIIIVACIGVAAAGYQISQTDTPLWDPSSTQDAQPADTQTDDVPTDENTQLDTQNQGSNTEGGSGDSGNGKATSGNGKNSNNGANGGTGSGTNTKKNNQGNSAGIGPVKAKSIASNHIEEKDCFAGAAQKTTYGGVQAYYVPVYKYVNGTRTTVGGLYISMKGTVLGGEGGG